MMGTMKTVLIGFEMKMMLSTPPTSNAHKMFRRILSQLQQGWGLGLDGSVGIEK
jgi:hypothetical protein